MNCVAIALFLKNYSLVTAVYSSPFRADKIQLIFRCIIAKYKITIVTNSIPISISLMSRLHLLMIIRILVHREASLRHFARL